MTFFPMAGLSRVAVLIAGAMALGACAGTVPATDTSFSTMPSAAANSLGLTEATVIPGTCARLVAGGQDMTAVCNGRMLLSAAQNGRIQIMATMDRGSTIMFSGPDLPNPDANTDAFQVDRISLSSPALPAGPKVSPAVGYCTYSNPYIAPGRVACSADIDGQVYEMAFIASGLLRR